MLEVDELDELLVWQPLLTANPYQPHMARIVRIYRMVDDNWLFTLRFLDDHLAGAFRYRPGQFVMLSVPGAGEAPISLSSSPSRTGVLELCARRVGRVTNALYRMRTNDLVGIRGPYGNGYPVEKLRGNDLLLAAGGLGMAPLRSLLWYALDHRDEFHNITLMYGAKTSHDMLFREELVSLADRTDLTCLLTVDADPTGAWNNHVGLLPNLFNYATINPASTYAAVCGPPVVYKFMLQRLLALGFSKDRILMSLERRMKCGVGKCGHCSVGYKYTCVHGPIFTYWDAINLPEMI
jgi:sulfhydrogenase subunit gamma (sulfur reductase)